MTRAAKESVSTVDIPARVKAAVGFALDRKCIDLLVLRLEEVCDFTDYFILCSGSSERQVRSIAEAVEEGLREQGVRPLHVEGLRQCQWVLIDFGDFVVHIFDRERRDFYRLDRLWSDAPDVTAEFSV